VSDVDFHELAARARIGTVMRAKWRLDRLLGVGGMGAVYAATHRNGKRVALKVLHPELSAHAEARARFVREGYVANAIEHRGVVSVLDDDVTDDGAAFLVMELLEGESLDARVERLGGVLPLGEVLDVAAEILDVLAAAHARGVVHRDIKPENVFVTRDGRIKLLDFGIARMLELTGGSIGTRTGVAMGTPGFMAPEQALGEVRGIGPATDVYAVGAMMFSLLSGELVHEGDTAQKLVIQAATRPARSLATAAHDAPAEVVALVDRALSFEAARRWPDARSMQDAVRGARAMLDRRGTREAAAEVTPLPAVTAAIALVARPKRAPKGEPVDADARSTALEHVTEAAASDAVATQAARSRHGAFVGVGGGIALATLIAVLGLGRAPAAASARATAPVEAATTRVIPPAEALPSPPTASATASASATGSTIAPAPSTTASARTAAPAPRAKAARPTPASAPPTPRVTPD
jgi:serine/threonine-protein kinase